MDIVLESCTRQLSDFSIFTNFTLKAHTRLHTCTCTVHVCYQLHTYVHVHIHVHTYIKCVIIIFNVVIGLYTEYKYMHCKNVRIILMLLWSSQLHHYSRLRFLIVAVLLQFLTTNSWKENVIPKCGLHIAAL